MNTSDDSYDFVLKEIEQIIKRLSITEKTLPETLDVHKFIKFFQSDISQKDFVATNESLFKHCLGC